MGLEPSQQREVWQEAVETAPNGKLTAAHVEAGRNGGQGIEQVRFLLGSEQKVRTYSSLVVNPGKAPLLEAKIR
jgi:surface antigen